MADMEKQAKAQEPAAENSPLIKDSSPRAVEKRRAAAYLNRVLSCLAYAIAGPALVLTNAQIYKGWGFRYPLMVGGQGLLTTGLLCTFLVKTTDWGRSQMTLKEVDGVFLKTRILPMATFSGMAIAFGNASYLFLDISLVNMLMAFSPMVVALVLFTFGIQEVSVPQFLVLFIIGASTATTFYNAPQANMLGVLVVMGGQFSEAGRLAILQTAMHNQKLTIIETGYYLALSSGATLLALSLIFELPSMIETGALSIIAEHWPWFVSSAAGGVAVNLTGYWCVQSCGSIVMKLINIIRTCAIVLFAVVIMGEVASNMEIASYSITIVAFTIYTFLPQITAFLAQKGLMTPPPAPEAIKD